MDKQEWNGEGLPPVGAVCECRVPHGVTGGYLWQECNILYVFDSTKECAVQHVKHGNLYYSDEFRPILTPEQIEKARRERVSNAFRKAFQDVRFSEGWKEGDSMYTAIYDAIRAGKIEGVKIDG